MYIQVVRRFRSPKGRKTSSKLSINTHCKAILSHAQCASRLLKCVTLTGMCSFVTVTVQICFEFMINDTVLFLVGKDVSVLV